MLAKTYSYCKNQVKQRVASSNLVKPLSTMFISFIFGARSRQKRTSFVCFVVVFRHSRRYFMYYYVLADIIPDTFRFFYVPGQT